MPFTVTPLAIPDVRLVVPGRIGDTRGFFAETYSRRDFAAAGIEQEFVQDNHSFSARRYTLRGLHYQLPPMAQAKLVRVVRGAILDVAVDLRQGSPSLGRHVAIALTAEAGNQLYLPEGFAHGFCTLEPDTEVVYKATAYYSREHDRGIQWNDPALEIDWPARPSEVMLSDKDRNLPLLRDIAPMALFAYRTG
jgi:dTDP-4-dehydrorhamnose 3,5-epimerase